jgi:uncharacterized protein
MQITQEDYQDNLPIQSYQPGAVTINDVVYTTSIIVSSQGIIPQWPIKHIQELTTEHLQQLLATKPQVILLGTGEKLLFPRRELLQEVIQLGIGIEVMDSSAACRTYNLLLAEGRRVTAGIIL